MAIPGRRIFLIRGIAALAAAWAGVRLAAPVWRRDWRDAGPTPTQPGWRIQAELNVWIVADEAGRVAALDRLCPHQGCIVQARSDDLWCPCHGSTFDRDGTRRGGPAPHGLPWYPVRRRAGRVEVDLTRGRRRAQWV